MTRAFIVALGLLAGCTDDGDDSPVGGWSNERMFACFTEDHVAGFGDHPEEPIDSVADGDCLWNDNGTVACDFEGEQASLSWTMKGDELELLITSLCSPDPADDSFCGPYLVERDAAVTCR